MEKEKSTGTKTRPPIVVVMGHVDHGKTSLLDYIRKTNVTAREAGGITQSIGAYEISHNGKKITFIDTPGHEAFSKMRSRGAEAADLAILVVAADEGVKPQTKEAIQILKDSKTPFVVAINKIDKPGANVEKIKQDLAANGVMLEGYGGAVSFEPISAKTGENVDKLLDLILLSAEMENLPYSTDAPAKGVIVEARRTTRRGIEASVIIKDGILKTGDFISTPTAFGKVIILEDFLGKKAGQIEPSSPALIIGFESLPQVGEEFKVELELEAADKDFESPKTQIKAQPPVLPALTPEKNVLNLVLKAADSGSLEVLSQITKNLPEVKEKINIVSENIGEISTGDIQLARSTAAVIVGFKIKPGKMIVSSAQSQNVKIISSDIVYHLIESIQELIKSIAQEKPKGELEILAVFNQLKLQEQTVGGQVLDGILRVKNNFDIKRGEEIIGQGRILSLQADKKDVNQAEKDKKCGLVVGAKVLIKAGDHLIVR
jgi:translation initiation factor IF-2